MCHQAHDKAVFAGHLVALNHLRNFLNHLLDLFQHARQRFDAHQRLKSVAQRLQIDVQGVALDHAALLQPPQPLRGTG
ncbi:hypothetical protein D3C72_2460500 [compost metagenome]